MIKKVLNTIAEKLAYFRNPAFRKNTIFSAQRNPHTGENALSIEIANYLKAATLEGKLNGVWTKIAHEASNSSLTYGVLMRNMGKNPGAADFVFTHENGHLWMELKVPSKSTTKTAQKSTLQPSQVFFKNWCEEEACNYFVVMSLKEAITLLTDYGILQS